MNTVLLILVDVLALLAFVVIGRITHHLPINLTDWLTLQSMLHTALPFGIGWFVAAAITRLYHRPLIFSWALVGHLALNTFLAVIIATPLRYMLIERFSPWMFYAISTLTLTFCVMATRGFVFVVLKKLI